MISLMNYLKRQDLITETAEEIPKKDYTFIRCAVTKFFTENPNPDDEDIHAFAEKMKISPHELEEVVYELLTALLKGVGKHKEVPVTEFDPEQIKMGLEVEKEHTDSEAIAQQIVKDHLAEIPDYYTRLKKMEDEAKANKKSGD
ncbi:MAG TPA: hypothetical protein PLL26_06710 [Candidatus Dojkabacteria bacterium]|nr:hypothetical protein [Candidatus Dojkabacteria bacterium]